MTDEFDAVIVGGGPAGASAAWEIALAGGRVAVLPRGAGQTGALPAGILWTQGPTSGRSELPGPGRRLVEQRFAFLGGSSLSIDYRDPNWGSGEGPVGTLATGEEVAAPLLERAVAAGTHAVKAAEVDALLLSTDRRVGGVRAGGEEFRAPVTIFEEGAVPFFGTGVAPRGNPKLVPAARISRVVHRLYSLPPGAVERRFSVQATEGATIDAILTEEPPDLLTAGFLVTCGPMVCAGVELRAATPHATPPTQEAGTAALDRFVSHSRIARLIQGGSGRAEGSSFRVPFQARARAVAGPGYLMVGPAAGVSGSATTFVPEWDHGLRSARCAAQAILTAGRGASVPSRAASAYVRLLRSEGLWGQFQAERWMVERLKWNRRVHHQYARFASELLHRMMSESGAPKQSVRIAAGEARREAGVRWTDLVRDALEAGP